MLFMKTSRDDKILEMYYECALKELAEQQKEIEEQQKEIEYLKNKLVEISRRIQELEGENLIWTQRFVQTQKGAKIQRTVKSL